MSTDFNTRCTILSELWLNYRDDEDYEDFIAFNDIALPLAHAISEGIVESTEAAAKYVNGCFDSLLSGFKVDEDSGFEDLDEIIEAGE